MSPSLSPSGSGEGSASSLEVTQDGGGWGLVVDPGNPPSSLQPWVPAGQVQV